MTIAAVYLRADGDRRSEDFRLDFQEAACRRYAATAGLTITGTYRDNLKDATETAVGLERLKRELNRYEAAIVYSVSRRTPPLLTARRRRPPRPGSMPSSRAMSWSSARPG